MSTTVNNPPVEKPAEQTPSAPPDTGRSRVPFNDREKMFVEQGLATAPPAPETSTPAAVPRPPEPAKAEPTQEAPPKPVEANPPAATDGAKVEPPKLYAGKYKTIEEFEAGYKEAQTIIAKQGTKVNRTLEEIAADTSKAKDAAPILAAPGEMPDPVLDPDKFRTWQQAQFQAIRNEGIATDKFKKAADEFSAQNKDLEDAKAMEWVNSRLLIDQRFVQGYREFLADPINYDLGQIRAIAQEHADYVRQKIGELRVAGRTEERQKQAEIMPQLTPQSPERPASGTPSTPEDVVDEEVRLRTERLNKLRTPMMRR